MTNLQGFAYDQPSRPLRLAALALSAALLAGMLSGCAFGPDHARPAMDLPDAWRAGTADAGTVQDGWWKGFGDPALDTLVTAALDHNRDLAKAIANVDEARAQLGLARANQMPRLDAQGSTERQRYSLNSFNSFDESTRVQDLHTAAGALSYEVDLWGRYRRATEAARAQLLSTVAARDTVRLALTAQVARTYFDLRAYDQQLQVARDTLASRESTQELRKVRFELGLTSELDYRQAIAEAASARSTVHTLQYNVAASEAALGVLTGRSPREIVTGTVDRGLAVDAVPVPPTVPAGLPSALLERRPDIVQAEQQLAAASANIGVAKAAYFPSISLTGLLGYESSDLTRLFTGPAGTWRYAGSVTMPIFDFGRVKAGVEAAEARQRAALAGYEKAVQDAFREAQDALVANRKARGVVEAQTTQVTALRRSLHLARLRYDNGYSSYLEVLDAERSLFEVEISLASAQRDQLVAVVEVYRALGGGWGGIAPQQPDESGDAAENGAAKPDKAVAAAQ